MTSKKKLEPRAPTAQEFVEQTARMTTEAEFTDGMSAEDAIATVNDLIETSRRIVKVSKKKPPKLKLYLYRSRESDDDGDPLDHGCVKAASRADACKLLKARVKKLGHVTLVMRLYHLAERDTPGVLEDVNVFSDHLVTP